MKSKIKAFIRGYLHAQQDAARKSRGEKDEVPVELALKLLPYLRDFNPPSEKEERERYIQGWTVGKRLSLDQVEN